MRDLYLGDADNRAASSLHADLAGLPPVLIHVRERETLMDDARRLAERWEEAGGDAAPEEWPEMRHAGVLKERSCRFAQRVARTQ